MQQIQILKIRNLRCTSNQTFDKQRFGKRFFSLAQGHSENRKLSHEKVLHAII